MLPPDAVSVVSGYMRDHAVSLLKREPPCTEEAARFFCCAAASEQSRPDSGDLELLLFLLHDGRLPLCTTGVPLDNVGEMLCPDLAAWRARLVAACSSHSVAADAALEIVHECGQARVPRATLSEIAGCAEYLPCVQRVARVLSATRQLQTLARAVRALLAEDRSAVGAPPMEAERAFLGGAGFPWMAPPPPLAPPPVPRTATAAAAVGCVCGGAADCGCMAAFMLEVQRDVQEILDVLDGDG